RVGVVRALVGGVVAGIFAVGGTGRAVGGCGLLGVVLAVGQAGYYHSKPRLLLPILLTIIPPAYLAARSRPATATLGILAYSAFGLWYGAYMITVWIYTI